MDSHAEAQEGKTQVREVEKLERLGGPREKKRRNERKPVAEVCIPRTLKLRSVYSPFTLKMLKLQNKEKMRICSLRSHRQKWR